VNRTDRTVLALRMRQLLILVATVSGTFCQANFGRPSTRLGLLGDNLGLSPTGESEGRHSLSNFALTEPEIQPNAPFVPQEKVPFVPQHIHETNPVVPQPGCCCVPLNQQCGDSFEEIDYVGTELINPRSKKKEKRKPKEATILTRIVNRPPTSQPHSLCPTGQKSCCYDNNVDLSVLGRTCAPPASGRYSQECDERVTVRPGVKTCGTRDSYNRPLPGLAHGESSPGEFPWACLVLNQNNDFIGSCALIPASSANDNSQGVKVITAAHKLNSLQDYDQLKVRVGEYDASGYNPQTEIQEHEEYSVTRILKHPRFNAGRLSNDIALLYVDRPIDLTHPYVNSACLPSCTEHTYRNNSGVRCWVAGWGKDEFNGEFQFIPHKVDVPLVSQDTCQPQLQRALNGQKAGSGNRFRLGRDEICAGGEEGKDACTGDGGSPLVCQSQSGHWTVVGLVTWGVGCASTVPGVYARVSHFLSWINQN